MSDREGIEAQIREVLASDVSAATLSEKLFSPAGLFNVLAPTEADRRLAVRSDLFRQAQAKFRGLQLAEGAAFAKAVDDAEAAFPAGGHRVKLEHVEFK